MCFPTLFHNGKGDPTAPRDRFREKVKWTDKLKHLLRFAFKNKDNTFTWPCEEHPTFAYAALNKRMREKTKATSKIYIQKTNRGKSLCTAEIKEILKNGNENQKKELLSNLSTWTANLTGSDAFWKKQYKELRCITEQCCQWTTFDSFSSADLYWKDIYRLLTGKNVLPNIKQRRQLLNSHPLFVTEFFVKKWNNFFEKHLKPLWGITDWYIRYENVTLGYS